jgi:hypothetical protein
VTRAFGFSGELIHNEQTVTTQLHDAATASHFRGGHGLRALAENGFPRVSGKEILTSRKKYNTEGGAHPDVWKQFHKPWPWLQSKRLKTRVKMRYKRKASMSGHFHIRCSNARTLERTMSITFLLLIESSFTNQ